jgi:hypothetical protein
MSASMLTSTESTITELTLVLLLRSGGLLGWRVAGRSGDGGSHVNAVRGVASPFVF